MKKLCVMIYDHTNKDLKKLTKEMMMSGEYSVPGKMSKLFLPMLCDSLYKYPIDISDKNPDILFPIYSEEIKDGVDKIADIVERYKKENPEIIVYNSPEIAKIIANKEKTHIKFSEIVGFPRLISKESDISKGIVFVSEKTGTCEPVQLIQNQELNNNKYNTEFIDTSVEFGRKTYFTCIRTQVMSTPKKISIINRCVRIRPNYESPSVHYNDTLKQDIDAITYFNTVFLTKYKNKMDKISIDLGKHLGPGFWVIDILPKDGKVYICEAGIKVTEQKYFLYEPFSKDVFRSYLNKDNKYLNIWMQETIDAFLEGS